MNTGDLNRRVTVMRRAAGVDDLGQPLPESWVSHVKLWASIKHPNGSQAIKADAPTSEVRASIRVRYRTDVDEGMRVVHSLKTYDIQAVLPDEVNRVFVDLVCEVIRV